MRPIKRPWTAKREIISELEGLIGAAPSTLAASIPKLSDKWKNSGSAGAVHDTVLEKRFEAALEAATKRKVLVEENPDLQAMRDRAEAADHVPSQAGSLPDPKVGLELSNVPIGGIAFDQTPMTGIQLKAMQRVPYPGKLRLKRETAQHAAEAMDDDYDEAKKRVVAQVEHTYSAR